MPCQDQDCKSYMIFQLLFPPYLTVVTIKCNIIIAICRLFATFFYPLPIYTNLRANFFVLYTDYGAREAF